MKEKVYSHPAAGINGFFIAHAGRHRPGYSSLNCHRVVAGLKLCITAGRDMIHK